MGTETRSICNCYYDTTVIKVKLNNPLMGTETYLYHRCRILVIFRMLN